MPTTSASSATHALHPAQEYAYNTIEVPTHTTDTNGCLRIIHALAFKTAPCALVPAHTLSLPSQRYMRIICDGKTTNKPNI